MTTSELLDQYVLPTYARFPLVPVRGQGAWLWDAAGRKYLDFCSGIATCSLGHAHPAVQAAIATQAGTLLHCSNLYQIPQQAELARFIVDDCVGIPGKVFFGNSGAEANDGLIKLARRFGHNHPQENGKARFEVITFNRSFHGRTLGSMSATAQPKMHEGYDPLLPGFRHVEFNDARALRGAIGPETAAILLEPIQGEGGIHLADREFLLAAKRLCDEHDLLLLLDEVQCGFGRAGDLMGWRTIAPGLEPDGISWAKGMGGGFPIGAFWVSDRAVDDGSAPLSSLMGPGSHGSTYGGNPLACAAALTVLQEIAGGKLAGHASAMGTKLTAAIAAWEHPAVAAVRGKGLMIGIQLDAAALQVPGDNSPAIHLCHLLAEAGLLVPPAGPGVIRFLPPLNVTAVECDRALGILRATLDGLAG
ncbi:MAG: acetylornithine transaminase [Akkermansiaceae bacterium]|nr:acetylornithine transaminase [Akkermansiaceae bacterium]